MMIMRPTLSSRTSILASGLTLTLVILGCGGEHPPHEESPAAIEARRVLERAAAALRETKTVRYDFEYGTPDDPTGWVTGRTWMKQGTDLGDSWIRVEGTVHSQANFGVDERSFAYGKDTERAWAREGDGSVEVSPVGAGANRLSATAVYGYLPEFVEASPLWRELEMATELELLEPKTVDGHLCDVVRVSIPLEGGGATDVVWTLSRQDHLPRRGRWLADFAGPKGMTFAIAGLETGIALTRSDFAPPGEAQGTVEGGVAVGDPVPDWSLPTPAGSEVSLADLAGEVVVLELWNTWCPICRSIGPATHELARELDGEPVRFFGVNLLESGDPVAYWNEIGSPYPLLLEGEDLAAALDLPWQPGIAVIGPDRTLLYKQLGASKDRIARVRAAIDDGIRRVRSTSPPQR